MNSPEPSPTPAQPIRRPFLFVSTLIGGGKLWSAHAQCCENLRTACMLNGVDLYLSRNGGTGVDRARNRECAKFQQLCEELKPTVARWLQVDDDVLFEPTDILKMMKSKLDVTSMVYPRKDIDWNLVEEAVKRGVPAHRLEHYASSFIFNRIADNDGGLNAFEAKITDESGKVIEGLGTFVEVFEVGTGCLMVSLDAIQKYIAHYKTEIAYRTDYPPVGQIHYGVFMCERDIDGVREKAKRAIIELAQQDEYDHMELEKRVRAYWQACQDDSTLSRYATEDWSFCSRWRAMGGKVHVFIDGTLTHMGTYAYKGNIKQTLRLKTAGELRLKVCPPEHAGVQSVLDGSYDIPGLEFDPPPVVIDIGANIGAFSVYAAQRWPGATIHAYEPHPDHVALMKQNVAGLNVDVSEVAVTEPDKDGQTIKLFDGKHNPGERSIRQMGEQLETSTDVLALSAGRLPPCDVLKIDTEGCEVEILEAYPWLHTIKALMLEWHSAADYRKLVEWLPKLGLTLVSDMTGGQWARDRNLIFVRNTVSVIDATEIVPNLWMGGYPPSGGVLAENGFQALVIAAAEKYPGRNEGLTEKRSDDEFPGVAFLHCPLWDSPLPESSLDRVMDAASIIAEHVSAGRKTLVTCGQGRNRSGLLVGMAIHAMTKMDGNDIVKMIRDKRPMDPPCLSNESFAGILGSLRVSKGRQCVVCGKSPAPHLYDHGDDGPYCGECAPPLEAPVAANHPEAT